MVETTRRGALGILVGGFFAARAGVSPVLASQPEDDRFKPLDTSKTFVDYGFRSQNGLILFFDFNMDDPNQFQFGDTSPYFFPGQMDVNKATNGTKMPSSGAHISSNLNNIDKYDTGFFRGTGDDKMRLEGAPKKDGQSNQLTMKCPVEGAEADSTKPDFKKSAADNRIEELQPLTSQEIAILNKRLQAGDIKLYQAPPIYGKLTFYELPNGKMLLLMHDYSRGKVANDKAFTYDPQSGQWQENTAKYYAPDAYHPQLGAGWQVDNNFLQNRGFFDKPLWGQIQGNQLVNTQEVSPLDFESSQHKNMLDRFFKSPASRDIKTQLPNPCNSPSIS